jgi:ATP-dependent exoDNAse (exonuclease V) alpha subunit
MVVCGIVGVVVEDGRQLMFLPGSAGTGKTFTIRAVIDLLKQDGKKCLVYVPITIAVVQYRRGTMLHFLSRLGTDEQDRSGFQSDIGHESIDARHVLSVDLIVVDEVSMLTPGVANRMFLTLNCISKVQCEFAGKRVFVVGDLLQLPPVVRNYLTVVLYRLITRMSW